MDSPPSHRKAPVAAHSLAQQILLDLESHGQRLTEVNVYGPNEDSPEFHREVQEAILYAGGGGVGGFGTTPPPPPPPHRP